MNERFEFLFLKLRKTFECARCIATHSTYKTAKVSNMTGLKLWPSFTISFCMSLCNVPLTTQRANRFGDNNSDTKQIACVIILLQRLPTQPAKKKKGNSPWRQMGVDSCTNCTHNDITTDAIQENNLRKYYSERKMKL